MGSEQTDTAVDGKIDGRTAWAYTAITAFARFRVITRTCGCTT